MPKLHVIGTGSLIEFIFLGGTLSVPVGKVPFLYLGPLSFQEYMSAQSEEALLNTCFRRRLSEELHKKRFCYVGECLVFGERQQR